MEHSGAIIVNTAAAYPAIPLEGAYVTVFKSPSNGSDIIAARYTGADGKTEAIALETPPRALSQTPDNGGVLPYALYDITVTLDNFYDVYLKEVPIFEGITSVLPVNMVPKAAKDPDNYKPRGEYLLETREPDLSDNGNIQ